MKRKTAIVTALTAILIFSINLTVHGKPVAEITYIKGTPLIGPTKDGPWEILSKGMPVTQGQVIKTGKTGIVEITLSDKSLMRLAPETFYQLDKAVFLKKKKRMFSARLLFGKLWARVSKTIGPGKGSFDIKTLTAVVGVRGTVYNVYAALDRSTLVSVYKGNVGVAPPIIAKDAHREEISWPTEVSEKKWEEIILGRLQRLYIGSDGRPGTPESFDPVKEKDEWAEWNLRQDAMQTGAHILEK